MANDYRQKLTRTATHIRDPRRSDVTVLGVPRPTLPYHFWVDRLGGISSAKLPSPDPENFARALTSKKDALFFLDSSFVDELTDPLIWDALLSKARQVVLVPPVERELAPWLRSHPENELGRAIQAKADAIWRLTRADLPSEYLVAHEYYVNLLFARKDFLCICVREAESAVGRTLTSDELKQLKVRVQREAGPSGFLLANKGYAERNSANRMTDEFLVVTALFTAITMGREVFILTKDEDLEEQFFKLQWLVDTHYRSMLLAERYADDPLAFRTELIPPSNRGAANFFEPGGRLVFRSEEMLEAVLPRSATICLVHTVVMGKYISQFTVCTEQEVGALFRVKSKTGGLNTDRFGERNFHLWLPLLQLSGELQSTSAIVVDHRVSFGGPVRIPSFDLHQAILRPPARSTRKDPAIRHAEGST